MTTTATFLRRLPKVQLHCHLEGTLRPGTFLNLAKRHGVALKYAPGDGALPASDVSADPATVYDFPDFQAFLMTFAAVSRSLVEPADYALLAAEYIEDAITQNVVYAELFISPSVWQYFNPQLDVRTCVQAIRNEFDAHRDRIETKLIADVTRNFGAERAMSTAHVAAGLRDLGVIGIGLGGDEARFPPELFADVFEFARANGLHTVAHAGEAAGARSVRAAVEILGAERIGHGVRALEDASVVEMLAAEQIALEVCPTSNFLTGAASRNRVHPLVELDRLGCRVTIDADDPALFKTSITEELAYVADIADADAVVRFTRNAIDASFASAARKKELHALLDAASLEPAPGRRTS